MAISVASYTQVANWQLSPATVSLTGLSWSSGDVVVVVVAKDVATNPTDLSAPTNANLTFTNRIDQSTGGANEALVRLWTAVAGSSQTGQQIDAADIGTANLGMAAWVVSGASGTFANASGGLTEAAFTFTPTAGSLVIYVSVDWAATSGKTIATGTGTATERTDTGDGVHYGVWTGDWAGVTATSTGFGITSYSGMTVAHGVIEILASAVVGPDTNQFLKQNFRVPFTPPIGEPVSRSLQLLGDASGAQFPQLVETSAGDDSATVTAAIPVADTAAGDDGTLAVVAAVPLADTASATDAATVVVAGPLAETATATDAVVVTVPVLLSDTAAAADSLTNVPAAVPLSETASASDVAVQAVAAPLADTATGDDLLSVQSDSVIVVDPNQAKPGFPWLLASWRSSAEQNFGDATSSGGSQNITLTDTATGTDALIPVAAVPLADTAAGADDLLLAAAISLSDGGNGDDSLSITVPGTVDAYQVAPAVAWLFTSPRAASQQNIGDTFSGPSALADSATGTDSLTVAPAIPLAETAAGADALTVAVTAALTETATATDLVAASVTVPLDDAGTAADSLSVQVTGGADANQFMPQNKWGITRPGVAIDPPALQLLGDMSGSTQVNLTETGTASDSLTISVAVVMTETAVAVDALAAAVVVPLSELVAAADSLALATVLALSETASAVDDVHIGGQGIQGNVYPNPASGAAGNVYPRSSRSIIGSAG